MTDLEALAALRQIARENCAVDVTFYDCGCHRVELWVGNQKITEEDRDLGKCVTAIMERIEMDEIITQCDSERGVSVYDFLGLQWTTEPPKEKGYYWIKELINEKVAFSVQWFSYKPNDSIITHWLGPLPVPEPPRQ